MLGPLQQGLSNKKKTLVCREQTTENMTKLFIAFSHVLSPEQIEDARTIGIESIVTLKEVDAELQKRASQIPPTETSLYVKTLAASIVGEAQHHGCTHFMVAGEPTLVVHASILARDRGMVVLQTTSERVSIDVPQADGSVQKTSIFKHVMFREVF